MEFQEAVKYVNDALVEHQLKLMLNDDFREINCAFTESFIVFMSQQDKPVPFGAVIGAMIGPRQDKLQEATAYLEALGEADIVKVSQVHGNWIVHPVNVQHTIDVAYGCDSKPIPVDKSKVFCGNAIHRPVPTRMDHLQHLNDITFKVNSEFLAAFPEIPETVPYKKTLPDLLDNANRLHLNHRPDTRGRTYCASHVNYQGTEYEKCLLQFSKELKVTEAGRQNIIEYANALKDDEVYLKFVAQQALDSEKTGIFIGADANASGIQLMSMLKGCRTSAASVGLTAHNDFYVLADQMAQLEVEGDSRKVFKQCSMQHFYGGVKTPRELLGEENLPKFYETLKTIAPGCQTLLEELQAIYWATPVFEWHLPDGFHVQQPVIETQRIEVTLPHNSNVKFGYAYKTLVKRDQGLEMAANVVHSVDGYVARELIFRAANGEKNDELLPKLSHAIKSASNNGKHECFSLYKLLNTPQKMWPMLGLEFLQKAYKYCLGFNALPSFDVISIHDDFKCHPNFLGHVKMLYAFILADIAESNLIKNIVEEINPNVEYIHQPNFTLAEKVRVACATGQGKGLS